MSNSDAVRVGDWVEVLPLPDIQQTLDREGALDGMPFMPEMAGYAGRRFRVMKSAHKTCDPTGGSHLRRLDDAVHLPTRCDGAAHDGCEARCLIFWKTAWLKRVEGPGPLAAAEALAPAPPDLARLHALTRRADQNGKPRYRCQVTEIAAASAELPLWDLRQYAMDVSTGNISARGMLAEFGALARNAVGKRAAKLKGACGLADALQRAAVPPDREQLDQEKLDQEKLDQEKLDQEKLDLEQLDLQPGEIVRVKPAADILATLDRDGKHRGLTVEPEMLRHCGKTYRVAARVRRMIDEKTGRMIRFANACVALEGVVCHGLDNRKRIFCPRSPLYYWREGWLQRVEEDSDERLA